MSTNDNDKLINEFLPAALEVQATPPPRFARAILWSLLLFIVLGITWACFGRVDIVAVAQGKLVPNGQVKTIQPLESGIVKRIYVTEGQVVKAGEPLVALDTKINQADIDKLQKEATAIAQDIELGEALLNYAQGHDRQKAIPSSQDNVMLLSSLREFDAKVEEFEQNLKVLTAERNTTLVNVRRYEKTLPIVRDRAQGLEKLNKESLVSTDQTMQLQQEYIEQQEGLAYEYSRVEEILSNIEAIQQQKRSYVAEYVLQKNMEVTQYTRELYAIQQDLNKVKVTQQQQLLLAPVGGVIENLAVTTVGGVVTPAQELMHLVPEERTLIVEAGLANKDIGFVTHGQEAEIKLEAFPFMKYGVVHGQITNISADAVEHEQLGLLFPIKTSLLKEYIMVNGNKVNLQPGMQATVEVKTGQRRIIEFLLAPILKGLDEGVRER